MGVEQAEEIHRWGVSASIVSTGDRCCGFDLKAAAAATDRVEARAFPLPHMASTYSFDVVSDFDRQELVNTLDQVRRDVGNRYDLKDSGTEIELEETEVVITTASDMTLQAVEDVLRAKATKRNLSLKIFDFQPAEAVGGNRVK